MSETDTQTLTKFCKFCGGKIHADAIICTLCGRQVEELKSNAPQAPIATPNIVINNANNNTNSNFNNAMANRMKNKWVSLGLCVFLGFLGAHKFYEGKIGMGLLYLFSMGLFGIGVIIDFLALLFKPNPYFV